MTRFPSFQTLRPWFTAAIFALWCGSGYCQQPNIVLIFSDDAGYADFGFMDPLTGQQTQFKTPNLDALAQQGVVFSNAYASSSTCSASRAGLLTGQFGGRFGVEYNFSNNPVPEDGVPASEVIIPQRLQELGYHTGAVGKWHIGSEDAKQPQNRGIDEFYGFLGGHRNYFGVESSFTTKLRRNETEIDWTAEPSFTGIEPDPGAGRYVTDALGDEAAEFVSQNAGGESPFFLYLPFSAPHAPFQAKDQDLAEFDGTGMTGNRKNVAAMTLAMDRAIGNVLSRLDDPNGDGDMSDSVADDTIVVFLNDNGGTMPPSGELRHDNTPLAGGKGTGLEGGIRTPMIVRAPGLTPGQFDEAVTALDIFPTLVAAAGGAQTTPTDGKNLLPYLEGVQTGQVHDALYWRGGNFYWAIRKGDWKLMQATGRDPAALYQLAADGTGEDVDLSEQEPEKFNELLRDYVNWEVTLEKPTTTTARQLNSFDAFRLRTDVGQVIFWRGNRWLQEDNPDQEARLLRDDSYANAVLVFHPDDNKSYHAVNNVSRNSGLSYFAIDNLGLENPPGLEEFVLNQVRLEGTFGGAQDQSATLEGYPVMFVRSLDGAGPLLTLGATIEEAAGEFRFDVDLDLVLHRNLIINGNGNADFYINGQIRDFYEPRKLFKHGQSTVTLAGHNTYAGDTVVEQGRVMIDGVDAALDGTAQVIVGPAGELTLQSGLIRTGTLDVLQGGVFNFNGGTLVAAAVGGDLTNSGGVFSPGASPATTLLAGDYRQQAGTLLIEIGGPMLGEEYDHLVVDGIAELAGELEAALIDAGDGVYAPETGDRFHLLTADQVVGQFDSFELPTLAQEQQWAISYSDQAVSLWVVDELSADLNGDNIVDADDLQIWESAFGDSATGDVDGDGVTSGTDFLALQRQQGVRLISNPAAAAAVPEPSTWLLAAVGCALLTLARWRRLQVAPSTRQVLC